MTLRAIAVGTGMASSDVAERDLHLAGGDADLQPAGRLVPPPAVGLDLGRQPGRDDLLHDRRQHADDVVDPYTGPILVTLGTTTIKAIAVRTGWSQSAVASATYRFGL